MKRKQRRHWYKISTTECPVCFGGEVRRERVYGKKPKDPMKRYEYDQIYDYCLERGSM